MQTSQTPESVCCICFNSLANRNIVHLKCTHEFHLTCIFKLIAVGNSTQCPLCRTKIVIPQQLSRINKTILAYIRDIRGLKSIGEVTANFVRRLLFAVETQKKTISFLHKALLALMTLQNQRQLQLNTD